MYYKILYTWTIYIRRRTHVHLYRDTQEVKNIIGRVGKKHLARLE